MMRLFIAAMLGIIAGLWEVSVVSFLPPLWGSLRPIMPLLVLILVVSGRSRALAFALPAAAIIDAYGGFSFDLAFVRYAVIVFVLELILLQFLTNRSVYASVSLVVAGRVLEWGSAAMAGWLGLLLGASPYGWHLPPDGLLTLMWDAALTAVGFLLIARFTKRFLVHMDPYARL